MYVFGSNIPLVCCLSIKWNGYVATIPRKIPNTEFHISQSVEDKIDV